jgi:SEC-C motif
MQEPPRLDIESSFNEFVKEFDGELVSELIPSNPSFENADYLFRNDNVVAELKCLKKDILEEPGIKAKLNALYDAWVHKRLVRPAWGDLQINTANLPIECQREVYGLIKKPIQRTIEKANRQIKSTKQHFNLPNTAGLLLIANDGVYSLESAHIIEIVGKILTHQYSAIDGFVYFTVNMRAMKPDYERDVNLWVPNYGGYIESLVKMVDRMADAWRQFYARMIGQDVPMHEFKYDERSWLESIKFIKPSPTGTSSANASKPKKIGRNQPCFCGSRKKYKKCHGAP